MGMCMCMGMWFIFLWTDKFFHDFLVLLCHNASMSTRTLFSVYDPGFFVSFQQPLYRGIIPSFGWVFFAKSICSISFLFKIIFNDNFFFVSEHHCVCTNVADKTNSVDLQRWRQLSDSWVNAMSSDIRENIARLAWAWFFYIMKYWNMVRRRVRNFKKKFDVSFRTNQNWHILYVAVVWGIKYK